jgi:hypothetical protein
MKKALSWILIKYQGKGCVVMTQKSTTTQLGSQTAKRSTSSSATKGPKQKS